MQQDNEENTVLFSSKDPGHCEVKELLSRCKLLQYLRIFLDEGFDSLRSVM